MLSFWETQSFIHYEYIIVGGGIVGLSTAASILEKQPRAKVLILEQGTFPTGASTKNAGFACFGSLTELLADIEKMGVDKMLALVERRWRGIAFLCSRLGKKAIDFKQYGGYELLTDRQESAFEQLEKVNQLLFPLFNQAVFTTKNHLLNSFGFDKSAVKHLIFNPLEGQIDPGRMMRSLLAYVQHKGAVILNGCAVENITADKAQVSVTVQNRTANQKITFTGDKAAVCTNAFTKKLFPDLEISPGRGQVLVTKPLLKLRFRGTFHFDEGFYYFRNFENRVIFGGGRNLDFAGEATTEFAVTEQILADLREKLRTVILPNQPHEIAQTWAGIMAFSADKQPIFMKYAPNVWIGTRLNGMGVAIGSTLGEELADKVLDIYV
jgi:glycine/D-amino acid oxidase-like deaminating enzyme